MPVPGIYVAEVNQTLVVFVFLFFPLFHATAIVSHVAVRVGRMHTFVCQLNTIKKKY